MEITASLKLRKKVEARYLLTCLLIIVIILNFFLIFSFSNDNSFKSNNMNEIKSSATRIIQTQWLKNSDFSTQDSWFYTKGNQGDNYTIDANISNETANYKILGNSTEFSLLSGTVNASSWIGWGIYNNNDFLLPDVAEINEAGCYVYHYLDENENGGAGQVHNFPSAHFKKNVSVSEDLSNYEISAAALDVIFNASVSSNVDVPGDTVGQSAIWDSATIYVEITDLENSFAFRIAEYKTTTLGQDTPPILTINNTQLTTVSERDLITALNLALDKDSSHSNFTIIMGIDIFCEDNDFPDYDLWNYLILKSFNLTFTYDSKVEQFSSISWNQIGNKIEGADIQIKNATLNFNYKIDYNWSTALSPFSEIRIIINNNRYAETIKLGDITSIFQEAKLGGFDITSLISKGVNITISIQVFIANTFGLGQNITISIDDVFLNVSLIETYPDIEPNLHLFLNGSNKTDIPYIEVPTGQNLNVTVKYVDESGSYISGGLIQLKGTGFVEDLIEDINLQQYTVIINTTEKLILGNNLLTVTTQKINYISKEIKPTIFVRKINVEFDAINELDTINIEPGSNAVISVRLNDTDFNQQIISAVVFYSWIFGQGTLTDSDNDGIYEGVIRNVPEGSYSITISAYGIEEYNFQDYVLTLNAIAPTQPDWTWLITLLSGSLVALVVGFTLYQVRFKYPPIVRKSRKIRKKIRKGKNTKFVKDIASREDLIKDHIESNVDTIQLEKKTENGIIEK